MKPLQHISLIGLPGSGKSSVAPVLAELTDRVALDVDRLVEAESGRSVNELFADEGEGRFRELEVDALRSALRGPPAVLATGGGIVTTPIAVELLAEETTVVWLRASTDVLVQRLSAHDELRPLLAGDPGIQLGEMAERRRPLYESVAEVVIDVDDLGIHDIAAQVAGATSVTT